jgi:hypothetical protein
VFVHKGGTFQVRGETRFATNSAQGGSGGINGKGCADGIFVHGNQPVILVPQSNETVTIEDEIADNDCAGTVSPVGAGGIDKTGAGSVNYVGAMKVSRDVNITAGTFRLMSSSLSSVPRLIVDGSTTRFETNGGAVFGDIVVRNSATLFPGFVLPNALPVPARIVNANVSFAASGARYEVYLAGTSPGSGHSQLVLPDTAVVNVALTQLVIKLKPGYVPALGDVFRIIDYGNASFSGNFVGIPANATTIVNGVTFQITYNDGFVRLEVTAVPVATPVIALSSNLNPSTTAQSFQLTATVSGSNGTPTGNVQFFDAGAPIVGCEARVLSAGQASCIVTLTAAGAHAVTAVYLGGSAYSPATSPVLTQTVTKSSVTVGVTTSVNPAAVNAPVVLTATVSRTAATGGVTFRADGVAIAGCGSGSHPTVSGVSYCNTSFATAGSRSISASFVGDANYHAASSSALTLQVGFVPGAPSLQGVTPAAPSAIGQATLAFLPPADDGGSAITSYTARCINVTTSQVVSATQATSPIVVSPLSVGMAYSCTVVASNVLGDGAPSSSATITAFASLNIDASTANGSIYDAATDGVMILRYMLGVRGDAISAGVIGATATRDAAQIAAYLDNIKSQLDIDGDGFVNAATDGLLITRHMRGVATVSSAYILNAFNPAGSRNNEDDITTYLSQMMP